jgi:hypothetical protein
MTVRLQLNQVLLGSLAFLALAPQLAFAQASKLQQSEPPQGVVSSAQQWVAHQEWFCIPRGNYNASQFAVAMTKRVNSLGSSGWEPVAMNQVSIAGESCFLVMFKAPKQK